MWQVLAELLKDPKIQIGVLLFLIASSGFSWRVIFNLFTTVRTIRDNHLHHISIDISSLRNEVKDVREGVDEINRFLREK